jgi:hypothetical protein
VDADSPTDAVAEASDRLERSLRAGFVHRVLDVTPFPHPRGYDVEIEFTVVEKPENVQLNLAFHSLFPGCHGLAAVA